MSPFLEWGDFHARSRFDRSTVPEEKWGTTRSLIKTRQKPPKKWVILIALQFRYTFYRPQAKRLRARKIKYGKGAGGVRHDPQRFMGKPVLTVKCASF